MDPAFVEALIYIGMATLAGFTLGCDVGRKRGRSEIEEVFEDRLTKDRQELITDAGCWKLFQKLRLSGTITITDNRTGKDVTRGEIKANAD